MLCRNQDIRCFYLAFILCSSIAGSLRGEVDRAFVVANLQMMHDSLRAIGFREEVVSKICEVGSDRDYLLWNISLDAVRLLGKSKTERVFSIACLCAIGMVKFSSPSFRPGARASIGKHIEIFRERTYLSTMDPSQQEIFNKICDEICRVDVSASRIQVPSGCRLRSISLPPRKE